MKKKSDRNLKEFLVEDHVKIIQYDIPDNIKKNENDK